MTLNKKNLLQDDIEKLNFESIIYNKLILENINTIENLWCKSKSDLKDYGFTNSEIKEIKIKLQLKGLDLSKKIY